MPSEATFRTELMESLKKDPNVFRYRIKDAMGTGIKPFDLFALRFGKFYGMELKFVKALSGFKIDSKVEPHQIDNLNKVNNCGGLGLLIINYRFTPSEFQVKKYDLEPKKVNIVMIQKGIYHDIKIDDVVKEIKNPKNLMERKGAEWLIQWDSINSI